jgi:uncharacterized membrane protein
MEVTGEGESRRVFDLERTIAFSDGVIAIAITLLVLSLDTPDLPGSPSPSELIDAIWGQGRQVVSFLISFLVIARFWIVHHRFCGYLERVDGTAVALNLGFLLMIVLIPWPTDIYGQYTDNPVGITLLAIVMALASAFSLTLIGYARKTGLMTEAGNRLVDPPSLRYVVLPAIFLLAIPVAWFISASWAPIVWCLLGFARTHVSRD